MAKEMSHSSVCSRVEVRTQLMAHRLLLQDPEAKKTHSKATSFPQLMEAP